MHWTDDHLLNHLYGISEADIHLDTCSACEARLQAMALRMRKQQVLAGPEFTEQDLAAQRRNIYRRLDGPVPSRWEFPWKAVLATATVLLIGLELSAPKPKADPGNRLMASGGDSRFYTEIYASMESHEPRAASPIRGLFEEQ